MEECVQAQVLAPCSLQAWVDPSGHCGGRREGAPLLGGMTDSLTWRCTRAPAFQRSASYTTSDLRERQIWVARLKRQGTRRPRSLPKAVRKLGKVRKGVGRLVGLSCVLVRWITVCLGWWHGTKPASDRLGLWHTGSTSRLQGSHNSYLSPWNVIFRSLAARWTSAPLQAPRQSQVSGDGLGGVPLA